MAEAYGARLAVVEMPPGPPVLQSVVAEVYGPDDPTRRQVAHDMTGFFANSESLTDVDNYMQETHTYWRFEVDTEKAVRRGISVDTINRNLAMAMGGYILGDVKEESVLESTRIVIQVPLALRSDVAHLLNLPIPTGTGEIVPLAELGRFVRTQEDPIIYHKDLRPVEYVVAESTGRLGAPIYGMFQVEDQLKTYTTPDGITLSGSYIGPPPNDGRSGFEWSGEWTVTYETFRDMGLAFGAALVLIYILVVWEFGNFRIPALIMAPIPLTLLGILPAHALMQAEFTATSMIGWIALAGIIVRNSILLVDFSIHEICRGTPVREAVILACKTRTRPIMITALALVAGSSVIITDPIFQGMAISLAAGVLVSTLLTLVVIPLGCVSASHSLTVVAHKYGSASAVTPPASLAPAPQAAVARRSASSFALAAWGKFIDVIVFVYYVLRAVAIMATMAGKTLYGGIAAVIHRRRKTTPVAPPEPAADANTAPPEPVPGGNPAPDTAAPPPPPTSRSAEPEPATPQASPPTSEETAVATRQEAAGETASKRPASARKVVPAKKTRSRTAPSGGRAAQAVAKVAAPGNPKPRRASKATTARAPRKGTAAVASTAQRKPQGKETIPKRGGEPAAPKTTARKRRGIRIKSDFGAEG